MKNVIHIVVAAITLGAAAGAAQARPSGSSLTREAHRVIDAAEELTREVNLHFRHSSGYRHLLIDAVAIRRKAEHIDALSHHVYGIDDVRHLQDDLRDLDGLVHHVGEVIEDIGRGRGRGHTHCDTRHVEELVASINRSLHSMERMVSEMERGCRHAVVRSYPRGHRGSYEVRYARPSVSGQIVGHVLQEIRRRH